MFNYREAAITKNDDNKEYWEKFEDQDELETFSEILDELTVME